MLILFSGIFRNARSKAGIAALKGRGLAQALKGFINLGPDALSRIGAVLGDIEKNVAQVCLCFRGKEEAPLH